jgi:predicted amidophosphoribosyltransferase
MQNSIPCPSCAHGIQVTAEGRLPPWCKACGATLSRDLTATVAATATAEKVISPITPTNPNSLSCPSCSRIIQTELGGRLPPWCKACGATLSSTRSTPAGTATVAEQKVAPIVRERATATIAAQPTLKPAASQAEVSHFQVVIPQILTHERLSAYRFYATSNALLGFPAGFGSIRDGQYVPQNHVSRVLGGIGHGAKMLNAQRINSELSSLRDAEFLDNLEGSSEAVLLNAVASVCGAVVIDPADLHRVRIESVGLGFALTRGFKCPAILKLGYSNFGTLALPSLTDARRAVEGLGRLLGDALEVDLPWGPKRAARW